jgi:hypothetical protein
MDAVIALNYTRYTRYTKTRLFRRIGIADKSDRATYSKSRFLTSSRNTARANDAAPAIIRIFAKVDAPRKPAARAETTFASATATRNFDPGIRIELESAASAIRANEEDATLATFGDISRHIAR